MSTENLRREFLKRAGAGLAGTGLAFQAGQGMAHAAGNPPGTGFYDVRAFGATGDGKTIDSPAVNKAIEAASAAGGGTVLFPAGNYLCYSIRLKNDISLYLDAGATIIAADPPAQGGGGFDPAEPNEWDKYQDFGHSHFHNSLIWGDGLGNIAILGDGRIWGRSLSRGLGAQTPGMGNKSISLKNCHNVLLRDFSILQRRPFRHPRHRHRQLDDRQSEDRYRPRRHGHRLLPQRAHLQLLREFPGRRWHLPEGRPRAGHFQADRVRHHHQLLRQRLLGNRHAARRHLQEKCAGRGYGAHQVRDRIRRRLPQYHHFELRVRRMPGAGARDRGRGHPGRHHGDQHFDARHHQRAHFLAIGQAHARSGRQADRHPEARHHQQHCVLGLLSRAWARSSAEFRGTMSRT